MSIQLWYSSCYSFGYLWPPFDHFSIEGNSKVVILALQHRDISQNWCISLMILNTFDSIPTPFLFESKKS
jgi:hypothetical protein